MSALLFYGRRRYFIFIFLFLVYKIYRIEIWCIILRNTDQSPKWLICCILYSDKAPSECNIPVMSVMSDHCGPVYCWAASLSHYHRSARRYSLLTTEHSPARNWLECGQERERGTADQGLYCTALLHRNSRSNNISSRKPACFDHRASVQSSAVKCTVHFDIFLVYYICIALYKI